MEVNRFSRPPRLLVFWSWSDFDGVFKEAFLNRPEYHVEWVSTQGSAENKASYRRLISLRHRLEKGDFDLVIANSIMRSPFPRNKGFWTTASLMLRLLTYGRHRLDTYWAPWITAGAVRSRVPLAAIDARDTHFIYPWDWPLFKASTLYFKRDLFFLPKRSADPIRTNLTDKVVDPLVNKLRPLSLGIQSSRMPAQVRPYHERDIDILFSGTDNNSIRSDLRSRCEKMGARYKVYAQKGLIPTAEYAELVQRTKMIICPESAGCETWRQYEVAAAGAVPVINWPYAQCYQPLEPDIHALYFSLIGDHFERQIEWALAHPEEMGKMAERARAFVLGFKDRRKLMDYVVSATLEAAGKTIYPKKENGIGV